LIFVLVRFLSEELGFVGCLKTLLKAVITRPIPLRSR